MADLDDINRRYATWRTGQLAAGKTDADLPNAPGFADFEQELAGHYSTLSNPNDIAAEINKTQARTGTDNPFKDSAGRLLNTLSTRQANLNISGQGGGGTPSTPQSQTPGLIAPPRLAAPRPLTPPPKIWTEQNADVTPRLKGLLDSGSPLMQQAETAGLQQANKRGLLNSSMAVGAAQGEAYKVAVPIASQEASQIHQRNLSGQQYQQEGVLQDQRIDSSERIAELGEEGALTRQTQQIQSNERISAAEIDSAMARLRQQGVDQRTLQLMQDASQKERLGQELTSLEKRALDTLNEDVRQFNAGQGATARDATATAVNSVQDTYNRAVDSIIQNKDLNDANRTTALMNAAAVRDSSMKLIEQIYNVDLTWDSPAAQQSAA